MWFAPRSAPRGAAPSTWLALALLLTLFAYVPSLGNDFTWDDRAWAMGQANPMVGELRPLGDYWQTHYAVGRSEKSRCFRPLTTLSFALRFALAGDDSAVAHLCNLVLHLLATFLAYLLLIRLGVPWQAATAGALVFGLHAIHSEVVCNVVGRSELLGFCCGAGAAVVYLTRPERRGPARVAGYAATSLLLFLAFSAKENALAWLVFLPLLALAESRRRARRPSAAGRRLAIEALVLALPVAAYLALRLTALEPLDGYDPLTSRLENPLIDADLATRWMTGTMVWGYALLLNLFPFSLSADYGNAVFPLVSGPSSGAFVFTVLSAIALSTVLVGGLMAGRRNPLLFLAMACFLGFSFIVSNIPLPVLMVFAERTYYTPSLAITFLVAWLGERQLRHAGAQQPGTLSLAPALLGAWLGACALVVVQRNEVWSSNERLIAIESLRQPRSIRLHLIKGVQEAEAGRSRAACDHFMRGLRLDPELPVLWYHLGRAHARLGEHDEAMTAFQNALQTPLRERNRIAHQVLVELGLLHMEQGRTEAALSAFERSFAHKPAAVRSRPRVREFLATLVKNREAPRAWRERAARVGKAAYATPAK